MKKHGHTASIMDYARMNYIAQPEDHIDVKDLIPRIGIYDEFAIEWGYRYFPGMELKEETEYLRNWVTQKLSLIHISGRDRWFSLEYRPANWSGFE